MAQKLTIKEDDILIAYMDWKKIQEITDKRYSLIFHYPAEGKFPVQYRVKLKRKGVAKGVPDILCLCKRAPYIGFAIELKSLIGEASEEQLKWLQDLKRQGYAVALINTLENAQAFTELYFAGRSLVPG